MAPLRSRRTTTIQSLALKLSVESVHELLPAICRLTVGEMGQNPLPLILDVRLDHPPESDAGVAANLLNSALIERSNSVLVIPVAWRRVEEDALAVLFVGELDDELLLLV